jgi:hypothetical protein
MNERIWLLLALSLASVGQAAAQTGSARPVRPREIHFADEQLPARQKELLARYANQIVGWAANDVLLAAAQAQSAQRIGMERILDVDRRWQAGEDPDGLATALGRNDCAQALLAILAGNPGYAEAFVTDSRGALVCMTKRTSDYWQGDEEKWSRAWAAGKGAVFVSGVERDDSTGAELMHISVPLREGDRVVGVMTAGRVRASG